MRGLLQDEDLLKKLRERVGWICEPEMAECVS
jgi:hypothetical protein